MWAKTRNRGLSGPQPRRPRKARLPCSREKASFATIEITSDIIHHQDNVDHRDSVHAVMIWCAVPGRKDRFWNKRQHVHTSDHRSRLMMRSARYILYILSLSKHSLCDLSSRRGRFMKNTNYSHRENHDLFYIILF